MTGSEQLIPDQAGRTWLVTGATNGVGRQTALAAAQAGARIILPARDLDRGTTVADRLRQAGAEVSVHRLDLASLASVREFAEQVDGLDVSIDVLVNNAGAVTASRQETQDGFELLIGTNFLGPFALTNLLAHRVTRRVVVVGSGAHRTGRVDAADLHFRYRRWSLPAAYAQSKLCDMLWARALQHRLSDRGSPVQVQLAHPGWAHTNIQNATSMPLINRVISAATSRIGQSAADGALPLLEAATGDHPPLSYIGPDGFGRLRGRPEVQTPGALALDDDAAQAIWDIGVRQTRTNLR